MAGEEIITRLCVCDDRKAAEASGLFRHSATFGGWYAVDTPTRSMSPAARYFAFSERPEHRHDDHTGEPMIYVECPWCGHTLPRVRLEDEQRPRPTTQSDGDSSCD